MPSSEVTGILIDEVETPAVVVGIEVQFEILVLTQKLGGIKSHTQGYSEIVDSQTDRGFVVGIHFGTERRAHLLAFHLQLGTRHVDTARKRPSRGRAGDEECVDVAITIALGHDTIVMLQHAPQLLRLNIVDDAGTKKNDESVCTIASFHNYIYLMVSMVRSSLCKESPTKAETACRIYSVKGRGSSRRCSMA